MQQSPQRVHAINSVDRRNHLDLAEEAFEKCVDALSHHPNAPQQAVVVGLFDANKKLHGLCLGHIPRLQPNGYYKYSPLPDRVPSRSDIVKHSSVNWLVSFSPFKGVGKTLMSMFEHLLHPAIAEVDTVSETPDYTPQAKPLAKKMGFISRHEHDEYFKVIHGLPMTAERNRFKAAAKQVLAQAQMSQAPTPRAVINLQQDGYEPLP